MTDVPLTAFPPLRPDQVAIGMPASINAGNGHVPPAQHQDPRLPDEEDELRLVHHPWHLARAAWQR